MAEHLPFASASTKANPGALMQQPGLNLILGRGGRGDVDFVRDGQASAVVQVSLCHESEAAVGRSPLGRSEWICLAESLSIWRRCGWCRGIEEDPSGPNINLRQNFANRNVAYRPYSYILVAETKLFGNVSTFYTIYRHVKDPYIYGHIGP